MSISQPSKKRKAEAISSKTDAAPSAVAFTSAAAAASRLLRFSGHAFLRHRLVLSILSGRPIRIDKIRSQSTEPGLNTSEASFLRLLEKITNGSKVEIGYTGTSLFLKPGVISGGKITHDCGLEKGIGWFLEWIAVLAPFAKKELHLTLRGITTHHDDLGADLLRTVTLPHLQLFLPTELSSLASPLELRIVKRGCPPLGGGEVYFCCPLLPSSGSTASGGSSGGGLLRTLNFMQPGRIRRMRGIASAVRVSPQMANRMIDAARGVLNRYVPDLYLFSDVYKGEESGKSPGYTLSLVATSTTGAIHCAEALSQPGGAATSTPEDVAQLAARALLAEIATRGCIDRSHQAMVLLLMALGPEDVSKVRLGALTSNAVQMLRDIDVVLGVRFKIRPQANETPGPGATVDKPSSSQPQRQRRRQEDDDADEDDDSEADKDEVRADPLEATQTGQEYILSCFGVAVRGAKKVG